MPLVVLPNRWYYHEGWSMNGSSHIATNREQRSNNMTVNAPIVSVTRQSPADNRCLVESPLGNLAQVDGIWTIMHQNGAYMQLLDASSREDAEQQVAEMLFLREDLVTLTMVL
jgi:hypothetical protein